MFSMLHRHRFNYRKYIDDLSKYIENSRKPGEDLLLKMAVLVGINEKHEYQHNTTKKSKIEYT